MNINERIKEKRAINHIVARLKRLGPLQRHKAMSELTEKYRYSIEELYRQMGYPVLIILEVKHANNNDDIDADALGIRGDFI